LVGSFEILEKINPNDYKVELPNEYGVSANLNVSNLSTYLDEDDELPSLRTNSIHVRGMMGISSTSCPSPRKQ